MSRYSRSMAKKSLPIILFSLLFACGCLKVEPTYKRTNIARTFQRIFKQEYDLDVKVFAFERTVWVYVPIEDFFTSQNQENQNTVRRVFQVIERVLLSMDKPFDFYGIIISSIKNKGIDFWEIGTTDDLRKFMFYFISYKELTERIITIEDFNPAALGDKTGRHIQVFDLDMPEFISLLLTQKLYKIFTAGLKHKNILTVKKIKVFFTPGNKRFNIELDIKIQAKKSKRGDIEKDIFNASLSELKKIINLYDYKDFVSVSLQNKSTSKGRFFTRQAFLSQCFLK